MHELYTKSKSCNYRVLAETDANGDGGLLLSVLKDDVNIQVYHISFKSAACTSFDKALYV